MFPWLMAPLGALGAPAVGTVLEVWDADSAVDLRDDAGAAWSGPLRDVPATDAPPWSVEAWYSHPGGLAARWDGVSARPTVLPGAINSLPAVSFVSAAPLLTPVVGDVQAQTGSVLAAYVRYDAGAAESVAVGAGVGAGRLSVGRAADGLARYVAGAASLVGLPIAADRWVWQVLNTRGGGSTIADVGQGAVWDRLTLASAGAVGALSLGGSVAGGIGLAGDALAFVLAARASDTVTLEAQRAATAALYGTLPPPDRLRFLPPARAAGTSLLVVNLTAGATTLTPTATQDVLAVLPASGWAGTLSVTGGRRLYVVGGIVDPAPTLTVSAAGQTLRGAGTIVYFQPSATAVAPALYLWGLDWRMGKVDFARCVEVGSPPGATDSVEVFIGNCWLERLPGVPGVAAGRGVFLSFVPGHVKRGHIWATLLEGLADQGLILRPSDATLRAPYAGVDVIELFDTGIEYAAGFGPVLAADATLPRAADPNGLQLQLDSATAGAKGWNPVALREGGVDGCGADGYGVWLTPDDPLVSSTLFVDPTTGAYAPTETAEGDLTWPSTLAAGMTLPIASGTLRVGTAPVDLCDVTQDFDALRITTAAGLDAMIGGVPVTLADDTFSLPQDSGATVLDVLANDTAAATLQVTAVSAPAFGRAVVGTNGRNVVYTPAPGYVGPDIFTYGASDGRTVATADVSLTVTAVASVTATPDSATTAAGAAVTVDVLANDSPSGLDLSIVTRPAHGTAARVAGTPRPQVRYTPAAGFSGTDSLVYKAFFAGNPTGPSSNARVGIVVTGGAAGAKPGSPFQSGLTWASGLNTSSRPAALEWDAWRGRKSDIFNSHFNNGAGPDAAGDRAGMVQAIKAKSSYYQWVYNYGASMEQVIDPIGDHETQGNARFDKVAAGDVDATMTSICTLLNGYPRRAPWVIRLFHEADATGPTAWNKDTTATKTHWRAAFEYCSGFIRNFAWTKPQPLIELNFIRGAGNLTGLLPASSSYDILGVDFYYNKNVPALASAADWDKWSAQTGPAGVMHPIGMGAWIACARQLGKWSSVAEWGVTSDLTTPGWGTRDNAWYIDGMYRDFGSNADVFLYDCYFQGAEGTRNHNLNTGGPLFTDKTNPLASAQYKADWTP